MPLATGPALDEGLLFPESPPPEQDGLARLYVQITFNRPLTQVYTYGVPDGLVAQAGPGKRMVVPLGRGNQATVGYCVGVSPEPPGRAVKPIRAVLDEDPLLTPAMLRWTRWLADYYLCGWGQVLDAAIPKGAKEGAGTKACPYIKPVPAELLPPQPPPLTKKQAAALHRLREHPEGTDARALASEAECGVAVLWALVRHGYATRELRRVERLDAMAPAPAPTAIVEPLPLEPAQAEVMFRLQPHLAASGFKPFLLHGVTGSGKTEIYLQAIQEVVRQGKEALVLVPEISLTPQAIQRFQARFPQVAALHSHLGEAERGAHWRRIARGQVQVVIGARSAIFAPTAKLGLIVIDEEHESSFKQETTPRYHARDAAVVRARLEGIPIILGSATPSLESWHNAQTGKYELLSLPERVGSKPLPRVDLIDLRTEEPLKGKHRAISRPLEQAMHRVFQGGGQAILLLNRRGYDTYLFCPKCGHVVKCRFCDVAMTHHTGSKRPSVKLTPPPAAPAPTSPLEAIAALPDVPEEALPVQPDETEAARGLMQCHYCGFEAQPPHHCPECRQGRIRYLGLGTEKLEQELTQKFPGLACQRMDSDTMRRPGSHAQALEAFQRGELRMLFGTQMIAKGLDFPNVTLVGVVSADMALHLPDFRAGERTFQLLAQVAGRTGRGDRGGRVLVQTFHPEHPSIALAAKHDYLAFASAELATRQQHGFPPFQRLARVVVRSRDVAQADAIVQTLARSLQTLLRPGQRLLGPAEAPLRRLEGYFRFHFLFFSPRKADLHEPLRGMIAAVPVPRGVDVTVDVDPVNML